MSEHDEIIAEAREKYTVHHCGQCEFRKSCNLGINCFDSDECRERRQSIMLGFGIEDGYFTKLLDRLEAAHKREIEDAQAATVKAAAKSASEVYEPHIQSEPVGNTAAMREAIDGINNTANSALTAMSVGNYQSSFLWDIVRKCGSARSAPPRNCDVGTGEEQGIRFEKFCDRYSIFCCNCPLKDKDGDCKFLWAQMPYEEVK